MSKDMNMVEISDEQGDIGISSIDKDRGTLISADGDEFREIQSNIWRKVPKKRTNDQDFPCDDDVRYTGASSHGGGVVLRPLYRKVDGVWRNIMTGKEAVYKEL